MDKNSCSSVCISTHFSEEKRAIIRNFISEESFRLCNGNQEDIFDSWRWKYCDWILGALSSLGISSAYFPTVHIIDRYTSVERPLAEQEYQETCLAVLKLTYISQNDYIEIVNRILAPSKKKFPGIDNKVFRIVSKLGFRLMEPLIGHYLFLLKALNPNNRSLQSFSLEENSFLFKVAAIGSYSRKFSCLPSSLQIAGALYLLGVWDDDMAIQLQKTKRETEYAALEIAKIVSSVTLGAFQNVPQLQRYVAEVQGYLVSLNYAEISDDTIEFHSSNPQKEEEGLEKMNNDVFFQIYKNQTKIGSGVTGTVFSAHDSITGAEVAIKYMDFGKENFDEDLRNLISEISYFLYLNGRKGFVDMHSCLLIPDRRIFVQVCKLYETSLDKEFMKRCEIDHARKFAEWKEYVDHIKKQVNFALFNFLKLSMRQLLGALCELSERGFVHGDIKPENILVSNNDVVLSDYGLLTRRDGSRKALAYAMFFRAPEHSQKSLVNSATDIWALGMSICYLFFRRVFTDGFRTINTEPYHTPLAVAQYSVEFLHEIEPNLSDLLSCMCCESSKRWTARQCLNHNWFKHNYV